MAEEEREKNQGRDTRRLGPPPVVNSRFAAAAAADPDRGARERDDRGPPPQVNSRFSAAADADRSNNRERDDRGPPPPVNSRFSAAADADRSSYRDRDDRGLPPQINSRFANAAAMAEKDDDRRNSRDGAFGRNDGPGGRGGGPPLPQNSRFAAAAAADKDYIERSDRNERDRSDDRGGGRFGGRDDDRRGGGGGRDDYDRRGGRDDRSGSGSGGGDDYNRPRNAGPAKKAVDDLLKPKTPALVENILKVPTKEHADNILKIPSKDSTDKPKAEPVATKEKTEKQPEPAVEAAKVIDDGKLLDEFVSGGKMGEDLKSWCDGQIFPSVERLVFHLLNETEKVNPNPSCPWAEPGKYGTAIVSLVEDDLLKQVEVLFGIQKYCAKLGFPKLNDEYVIQAMFRSMYKYDLAESDAFSMWKEDESSEHEAGKMTSVIQTVDWFNWLEEDEEEDEEDEEE
jgi:hypothetical protein